MGTFLEELNSKTKEIRDRVCYDCEKYSDIGKCLDDIESLADSTVKKVVNKCLSNIGVLNHHILQQGLKDDGQLLIFEFRRNYIEIIGLLSQQENILEKNIWDAWRMKRGLGRDKVSTWSE